MIGGNGGTETSVIEKGAASLIYKQQKMILGSFLLTFRGHLCFS